MIPVKQSSTGIAGHQAGTILWADNTRVIAIVAVIVVHVVQVSTFASYDWWVGNVYQSLLRWCVPVFVMLSGALLLDQNKMESLQEFYKKRGSRILIPLLFWSGFYLVKSAVEGLVNGQNVPLSSLAIQLVTGNPSFHMWFLFMILGLYLVTPFLRKIVRHSSRSELMILTSLLFAISMLSALYSSYFGASTTPNYWWVPTDEGWFTWFRDYLPYFLAGHLIVTTRTRPNKWALATIFLFTVMVTAIGTRLLGENNYYFYGYLSATVVPMSISFMFLFKGMVFPIVRPKISRRLAELTLGVYLVHVALIEGVAWLGLTPASFNTALSVPVVALAVLALSLAVTQMIHMIPYIRRTV